jgi:V/A-type H+-transporting ATPase subunit C
MAEFDYGNARIRVMKSRLLVWRELEVLAESGSLQGLIAGLSKTAYCKPVESALTRTSGIECVSIALREDLEATLGKLKGFFDGEARELLAIILRAYDAENLKAILRGVSRQASPQEIFSAVLPVGEIDSRVLAELANAPDPRQVIDLLASMAIPLAQPLLKLRVERPGAGTILMEIRLDQWFYRNSFHYLREEELEGSALKSALEMDADQDNLMTVFRIIQSPEERARLRDWLDSADLTELFVGPGKLSFDLLARAGAQTSIGEAVESLSGTVYEVPLREGLVGYAATSRLSEFEKQLQAFRERWAVAMIPKDPLGIGVVLGYLALKLNEIRNLRWIAHGINSGLPVKIIRSELVKLE